jgi:hypothetical protein
VFESIAAPTLARPAASWQASATSRPSGRDSSVGGHRDSSLRSISLSLRASSVLEASNSRSCTNASLGIALDGLVQGFGRDAVEHGELGIEDDALATQQKDRAVMCSTGMGEVRFFGT